ncbi:MAG: oligosaccharide flippase family protein [Phycisphaerales bacterium]|nr:MAG: oligosaccharide flippase family protein [Phycisphaerales bacterium]
MAKVTAKGIGRNTLYGVLAQVWRIGSRIVLTPLIIAKIGLEGYGTWTLLFTLCAYAAVVDRTFSTAYGKFTAEFDAMGDYRRLSQIISSGVAFVTVVAVAALVVVWLFRSPVLRGLGVPNRVLAQASRALLVVCVAVSLRMSLGYVLQVLAGLQRMDLQYKLGILASAVEFVTAIALLCLGWDLLGLAMGHLCGQVLAITAAWWLCRRLCPELRVSPHFITLWGLRRIVSLGGRFQLLAILRLLMDQGTKMLISGLLGVATLALYELAFKLLSLGSTVGGALVAPLMPAFANLYARDDRRAYRSFFTLSSKAVAAVSFPCFAFIAIFADQLILLWTGQEYPLAAWTTRCLALGFFALMLTSVGTASLRGQGTIRLEMGLALITTSLLALLLAPGYMLWGYRGIVGAILAGIAVGPAWFVAAYARRELLDLRSYLHATVLRPAITLGPPILAIAALAHATPFTLSLANPRWNALAELTLWGVLFSVLVGCCGWFFLLSSADRARLETVFRPSAAERRRPATDSVTPMSRSHGIRGHQKTRIRETPARHPPRELR